MGTLPYKTNRSYIRWEPYHAKVGIINGCVETQSFFIHKIKLSYKRKAKKSKTNIIGKKNTNYKNCCIYNLVSTAVFAFEQYYIVLLFCSYYGYL